SGFAEAGVDEDFHKGDLLFGQVAGDPENTPNPNLGPISQGPFYAIAVVPTPLATAFGISINRNGQVVDEEGIAILGLYSAGNDAQDRKSTRLNSSHVSTSYAVFCLKK